MKDFFVRIKFSSIISSILCLALGVVLIVWPDNVAEVISSAFGIVLLVSGLMQVIMYFTDRINMLSKNAYLLVGIVLSVIGIWILVKPEFIINLIPYVMGIFMLFHGITDIRHSMTLNGVEYKHSKVVMVLGIILLILGIIVVLNPFATAMMLYRAIGVFFLFDGLTELWTTIIMIISCKNIKKMQSSDDEDLNIIN